MLSADISQIRASLAAHLDTFTSDKTNTESQPKLTLNDLFEADPNRFETFTAHLGDLTLDYSKNRITKDTMALLNELAKAAGVEAKRDAMFAGEAINSTEKRAVLHVALRAPDEATFLAGGHNVMPDIKGVRDQMLRFADEVRSGSVAAHNGRAFTDVINIGIGGSDLGPAMAAGALSPYRGQGPRVHFISNVDGAHIADTLAACDPATTLILIASKTFTTQETMTNAATARRWLVEALGEDAVGAHFAALSTNIPKVKEFGISEDRIFGFWDWVGGRYSVWSAIGLPVAIAIGSEHFRAFLAGAHDMDEHFKTAPILSNLPMIMGLISLWYRLSWGFATHAVLPYDQRLNRFAAHLQQLDMESNGKSVQIDGADVTCKTGPVLWGEPGTNGQHAFYQLIHQGTDVIPCDFLIAANGHEAELRDHHDKLTANCLAQTQALMKGRSLSEATAQLLAAGLDEEAAQALAPHKVFSGNRPSNTLLYAKLDPYTLGRLIALYEHRTFVIGAVCNINSFDQWGVELGKELASALLPAVKGESEGMFDASTSGQLARLAALRG